MIIDGVLGSEAIDSSGEILDIEGADISDWEQGTMLLNWEHTPGESGASTIVGKVVYAKKIFDRKDCENDRQRKYWDQVEVPFIYGVCRLWDKAGHAEAKSIAAIIRDCAANDEPIVCRFSVEGSTLKKEGNKLKRSVIRRVAVTTKPCNRTAVSGLVSDDDPAAPKGYGKASEKETKKLLPDGFLDTEKHEHPMYMKLGGSVDLIGSPLIEESSYRSLVKSKIKAQVIKNELAEREELRKNAPLPSEHFTETMNRLSNAGFRVSAYHDGAAHKLHVQEPESPVTVQFSNPNQPTVMPAAHPSAKAKMPHGKKWQLSLFDTENMTGEKPVPDTQHENFESIVNHALEHGYKIEGITGKPHKEAEIAKAITAGVGTGAPGTLTDGAALQREDVGRKVKKEDESLYEAAKKAMADYDEAKDGDLPTFLKARLPMVNDEFIDHFKEIHAKLKKSDSQPKTPHAPLPSGHEPKVGDSHEIHAKGMYPFSATVVDADDTHVTVGQSPDSTHGVKMPKASFSHFVNDLRGVVHGPPSQNPHINAVVSGKAEHIGKGDDGVVFRSGDKAVKVSTTVPYHPFDQTNLSPEEAANRLVEQSNTNNALLTDGVPGILPIESVRHGDKAYQIRPYLDIPEKFTREQLDAVANSVLEAHKKGWVFRDKIQVGLLNGQPFHFDTGKVKRFEPAPENWKHLGDEKYDDIQNLKSLFRDNGHVFLTDEEKEDPSHEWENLIAASPEKMDAAQLKEHQSKLFRHSMKMHAFARNHPGASIYDKEVIDNDMRTAMDKVRAAREKLGKSEIFKSIPQLEVAPQQSMPTVFLYQRVGMDNPHILEVHGNELLLDGSPLNDVEREKILHNIESGVATIRYKNGMAEEMSFGKNESIPSMPVDASTMPAQPATSVSEVFERMNDLAQKGSLHPNDIEMIRDAVFLDPMCAQHRFGNRLALDEFKKTARPGVSVFIDLNNFKSFNDQLSHAHGDQAIVETAGAISRAIEKTTTSAKAKKHRAGGDEFHVYLENADDVPLFLHQLRQELQEIVPVGGTHKIAVSVGVGADLDQADKAQNLAKMAKRAAMTVAGFNPDDRSQPYPLSNVMFVYNGLPGKEGDVPQEQEKAPEVPELPPSPIA